MQKQAFLTLLGLALAAMAVAWIQPNTTGGTAFIVVVVVLFANAFGILPTRSRTEPRTAPKLAAVPPVVRGTGKAKAARK